MVIKALYYILAVCGILAIFLLFQEPYFLDLAKSSVKLASIEMEDLKDFEIDDEVVRVVEAKKAYKYEKENRFEDVKMLYKKDNSTYLLKANKASHEGDIVRLKNDIVLTKDDGYEFNTDEAIYDMKSEILSGTQQFWASFKNSKVTGEGFVYNAKQKDIKITKVKAIYEMEDK